MKYPSEEARKFAITSAQFLYYDNLLNGKYIKKLITKQLLDNVLISQILRLARCRDTRLDTSRQLVTRETYEVEGE